MGKQGVFFEKIGFSQEGMDCCWTVKKKESEKMDVPPTTLTEKDDMDDQEFMVWLYDHYEERMLRTAKKYCRDAFLWEEILQESFLRLLSRIPKLRALKEGERLAILLLPYAIRPSPCSESRPRNGDGAFPWRRVLCLWRDACRRNGSFKENGGIRWPLSGLSLPPTERFLLEGRYFQQRSDRELSDDLGCGANSIRMMMTRARRHVQRLMRREGEEQTAEQQK